MAFPAGFSSYLPNGSRHLVASAISRGVKGSGSDKKEPKPPKRKNWLRRLIDSIFK